MKNKKQAGIIFAVTILFACHVNAQNLYLNVGAGYAFPAASQIIDVNHTPVNDENIYGSFGKGVNIGAGIGAMFTDYIGAELGLSYHIGAHYDVMDDAVLYSYKGNTFRIIPAIKITGGENVKPYAKFGFVIGLGSKVDVEVSGSQGNNVIVGTEKLSGGSSTGWMGAFGLDFNSSSNLSIFVELVAIAQSYTPDKFDSNITFSNGNVATTEIESRTLVDNLPDGANGQSLAPVEPFSSIGVNAGIKLSFGGSK